MARHTLQEGVLHLRARVAEQDGAPVESSLDVYVRGADHVLCVFREGPQKGRKILVVGDRTWLLVPGTANPIPIGANQRLLGGAAIADVARLRLADDFIGRLRPEQETVDGQSCHIVDLKKQSPKAPYASGTLWIGAADRLPRKLLLSLPSGKAAKEIDFSAYGTDRGRTVLRRLSIRHLLRAERGSVTTLDFVGYEQKTLAPDFFDLGPARML